MGQYKLGAPANEGKRKQDETLTEISKCQRFVNTDLNAYLTQHQKICTGCRKCLKQEHKTISFKYPKTLNTRYNEQFAESIKVSDLFATPKQNFNYDRIRQIFKDETRNTE